MKHCDLFHLTTGCWQAQFWAGLGQVIVAARRKAHHNTPLLYLPLTTFWPQCSLSLAGGGLNAPLTTEGTHSDMSTNSNMSPHQAWLLGSSVPPHYQQNRRQPPYPREQCLQGPGPAPIQPHGQNRMQSLYPGEQCPQGPGPATYPTSQPNTSPHAFCFNSTSQPLSLWLYCALSLWLCTVTLFNI